MPKTGRGKLGVNMIDKLKKELEKAPRPKLSNIATSFITAAGGEKMVGQHLWKDYNKAEPGTLARQRIIAIIAMSLKMDVETYSADALDDMDEQDLETLFVRRLKELGAINDGAVQDPADAEDEEASEEQVGEQGGLGTEAPAEAREESAGSSGFPSWFDPEAEGSDEDGDAAAGEAR